jgi:hypothetical protein
MEKERILAMSITGQVVNHKTYGSGIITAVDNSVITVSFEQGDKKFIYPDAFKDFLILTDRAMQKQLDTLLTENELAKEAAAKAAQEEHERLYKIRNFKIISNSQAVFDLARRGKRAGILILDCFSGHYLSGI